MEEDEALREKIRSMLTPDTIVCTTCIETYKEEATCARCGTNMLSPKYTGKVYECPVCEKRYCEKCWDKLK